MTDPSNLLDETIDTMDDIRVDDQKNYLEELVGDNKKFKTPEDLAKGKYVSDNYIQILERRLDEMRDEYKNLRDENIAGQKLQDLIDKLETTQALPRDTQNSNEDNKAVYDPKEVESLVSSSIQKYEQTKKEADNFNTVRAKLEEHFGRNYKSVLKEQSDTLGLTDDEVNLMARRNPRLFLKTFDLDKPVQKSNFQTPPRSDKRSDSFAPRAPEKRTWSYYQEMRKKDPMAWMDKKIAVQMEKDAQTLGQEFFD